MSPELPRTSPQPASDRRGDPGLRFDPDNGRLRLGRYSVSVATDADNSEVLRAYVEVAARARGDLVAHVVDVRHADVEALAAALDLEAADLEAAIEEILGASRAEAAKLVARLRESRVIGGITKAAAGALLASTLAAGCAAGPANDTTASKPAPTTTTTAPVEVELIPPATLDAPG